MLLIPTNNTQKNVLEFEESTPTLYYFLPFFKESSFPPINVKESDTSVTPQNTPTSQLITTSLFEMADPSSSSPNDENLNLKRRKLSTEEEGNEHLDVDGDDPSLDPFQASYDENNLDAVVWTYHIKLKEGIKVEDAKSSLIEIFSDFDSFESQLCHINNKGTAAHITFFNENDFLEAKKIDISNIGSELKTSSLGPHTVFESSYRIIAAVESRKSEEVLLTLLSPENIKARLLLHEITGVTSIFNPEKKLLFLYFYEKTEWLKFFHKRINTIRKLKKGIDPPLIPLYHLAEASSEGEIFKVYLGIIPKHWINDNVLIFLEKYKCPDILQAAVIRNSANNQSRGVAFVFTTSKKGLQHLLDLNGKITIGKHTLKFELPKKKEDLQKSK
jgi:hypothetical protein